MQSTKFGAPLVLLVATLLGGCGASTPLESDASDVHSVPQHDSRAGGQDSSPLPLRDAGAQDSTYTGFDGFSWPDGFTIPDGFSWPDGFTWPDGFSFPDGFSRPDGFTVPDGFSRPDGFAIPDGFNWPEASVPDGFSWPDGFSQYDAAVCNRIPFRACRTSADCTTCGTGWTCRYEICLAR